MTTSKHRNIPTHGRPHPLLHRPAEHERDSGNFPPARAPGPGALDRRDRSGRRAARIAAMQAAEKNIEERLDELNGAFNKKRQSAITEELLDVVTGFEALGGIS